MSPALHPSIKLSLPDLPADLYLDRLCERLDEEMRRWGVLYYSEVLDLYMQKAGWIDFCMAFEQKGQAASLLQKLYQFPHLSNVARSFVLNHVGAILNTYVVTALEPSKCIGKESATKKFPGLGLKLNSVLLGFPKWCLANGV